MDLDPISCPGCGMQYTESQIMRIRQSYASRKRKVKTGGKNGGRPAHLRPEMLEEGLEAKATRLLDAARASKAAGIPRSLDTNAYGRALLAEEEESNESTVLAAPRQAVLADLRNVITRVEQGHTGGPIGRVVAGHIQRDFSPSPYQQSEGNRAWLEELAKLKKIGSYDEGEATERFVELLRGAKLPQGFRNWSDSKKAAYLTEHVPLDGEK